MNSQHFIFFITYKWAQQARELHYNRVKDLPVDKHSCLFRAFISYEQNEVLWISLVFKI